MAQNLVIAGATFNDVPSVDIPISGGGTARFVDTSDANATAGNIAKDKTAYVNGQKIVGTSESGGKPEQTKTASYTANGTYDITPDSGYAMSKATVTVAIPAYDGRVDIDGG